VLIGQIFSTSTLYDNTGWILNSFDIINTISFFSQQTPITYNNTLSISELYISIKLNDQYHKGYRKYPKVFDLAASIGGIMKVVTSLFQFYAVCIRPALVDMDLIKNQFNTYRSSRDKGLNQASSIRDMGISPIKDGSKTESN
jgi:hypothetical protein